MGAFDVETEEGKKDTNLVKFEVRGTVSHGGRSQPASEWVNYAKKVFEFAAENRKRPKAKDDPDTPENETEKTSLIGPEPGASLELRVSPNLSFKPGDETQLGLAAEFRYLFPSLLDGKLQPFIFTGIGTGGLSAGGGASVDPLKDMSLFLAGKAGIRTEWFRSIEVGGGVEAGWAFGESRSLRLGIGWEMWERLDSDKKRTHLLNLFFGKTF
jgi:hypothetical protein